MKVLICFPTVDRLDKKTSLYILHNIGDQFCSVMQEEKKAITCAEADGKQGKLTAENSLDEFSVYILTRQAIEHL